MTRLSGKIAIVTGAGIGIGQAIAKRFAAEGAHVWVTDINGETAEETVRDINAKGGAATAMVVDVSKGQDLTALVRNVEVAHARADILVNNAGILVRSELRQLSDADWDKLREVNVDAILRLSRDALPLLRKGQNPSIINISSIMAHRGLRPCAHWPAEKMLMVEGHAGGIRQPHSRHCRDEADEQATTEAVAPIDFRQAHCPPLPGP